MQQPPLRCEVMGRWITMPEVAFRWEQHSDTPGSTLPILPGTLFFPPHSLGLPRPVHMGRWGMGMITSHRLGEKTSLKQPSHHPGAIKPWQRHTFPKNDGATNGPSQAMLPRLGYPNFNISGLISLWFQDQLQSRGHSTTYSRPRPFLLSSCLSPPPNFIPSSSQQC